MRSREKSKLCKELHINENAIKQAFEIYENLKLYLKKYQIDIRSSVDDDGEDILKSFLSGFFLNIAQKQPDGSYRSLRWNIPLHIHPSSVLYQILPDYVMFFDVISN
jgi:ATP-dependent RNA helicase DDX35